MEVSRIRKAWERTGEAFLKRVFTPDELAYCRQFPDPWPHLGSRFAAKESVIKALGLAVDPIDVEIRRDDGPPWVLLRGSAKRGAEEAGVVQVLISMSHTGDIAVAQAIALGREQHR